MNNNVNVLSQNFKNKLGIMDARKCSINVNEQAHLALDRSRWHNFCLVIQYLKFYSSLDLLY